MRSDAGLVLLTELLRDVVARGLSVVTRKIGISPLLKPRREESELREERYDPSKKSIPSDWRKMKEFVEHDAELYGRSYCFNAIP